VNWLWLRYGDEVFAELERWRGRVEREGGIGCNKRMAFVLSACDCGIWEFDLLSGRVNVLGLNEEVFGSKAPETMEALRQAVHPSSAAEFDRFISRAARSTTPQHELISFVNRPDVRYRIRGLNSTEEHGVRLIGTIGPEHTNHSPATVS
jgi:hypothetical protein